MSFLLPKLITAWRISIVINNYINNIDKYYNIVYVLYTYRYNENTVCGTIILYRKFDKTKRVFYGEIDDSEYIIMFVYNNIIM